MPVHPKIPKLVSCKSAENESKINLISIIKPSITGEEFPPEQEMGLNIILEKDSLPKQIAEAIDESFHILNGQS